MDKLGGSDDLPSMDMQPSWSLISKLVFLQIQRNLQIRIEEQGKHLQMMFEQQKKMEEEKKKTSSANSEGPQSSDIDGATAKELTNNADVARFSDKENPKEMHSEGTNPGNHAPSSPPTKRVKTGESRER